MKKLKNLALWVSLTTLTTTLPFITYAAQPLPVNNTKNEEKKPIEISNVENKNVKRNQKEEMVELLVQLYNKYNFIIKKGLEINDVKNSSLYLNITKQKKEIKNLLDEIMDYPYNIVNKDIEQKFLKSNMIFCYLNNEYLKQNNLEENLKGENREKTIVELKNIYDLILSSLQAIDYSKTNLYNNIELHNKAYKLSSLVKDLKNSEFNSYSDDINISVFQEKINEIYSNIDHILSDYIYVKS